MEREERYQEWNTGEKREYQSIVIGEREEDGRKKIEWGGGGEEGRGKSGGREGGGLGKQGWQRERESMEYEHRVLNTKRNEVVYEIL
jgi:hypothetical protein